MTAIDPRDQTIEAIEAVDGHRIIGLQWHPEFLVKEEKRQSRTLPLFVTRIVNSLGFLRRKR